MGYTVTATNKAGLTRKLKNLGYQPFDNETGIGFDILETAQGDLRVAHHTYQPSTAAETLMANDYGVDQITKLDWSQHLGKHVETFYVYGKKHYN